MNVDCYRSCFPICRIVYLYLYIPTLSRRVKNGGRECARIDHRIPVGYLILENFLTRRNPLVDLAIFFPCRLSIDVDVRYRNILSSFWEVWRLSMRENPVDSKFKPLLRNDNFDVVQDPLYSGLELGRDFINDGCCRSVLVRVDPILFLRSAVSLCSGHSPCICGQSVARWQGAIPYHCRIRTILRQYSAAECMPETGYRVRPASCIDPDGSRCESRHGSCLIHPVHRAVGSHPLNANGQSW